MNVSKQLISTVGEDGISMYLSFDDTNYSESNISYKSTATYNGTTLGISDASERDDSNGNTTLEPQIGDKTEVNESCELHKLAALAPLRSVHVFSKFQSSTPSKIEGKNFDPKLLSENGACFDSKEKSNSNEVFENLVEKFENSLNNGKDDDKENKPSLVSSDDSMPSFSKTSLLVLQEANKPASIPTDQGSFKSSNITEKKLSKAAVDKKVKMHSVARKSLCEPNLQTNRPSRIVANKRFSCLSSGGALNVASGAWPSYRSSKFGDSDEGKKLGMIIEQPIFTQESLEMATDRNKDSIKPSRKSIKTVKAANIARRSILPSVPSEICYAPPRFATVVKTTLNSSTRKATIGGPNSVASKRRSVLLLQNKLASPLAMQRKRGSRSSYATSSDSYKSSARAVGGGDGGVRSSGNRPVTARRTMYNEKPANKFTCSECGAYYNTMALLEAHKSVHRLASSNPQKLRSHGNAPSVAGNHSASASSNKICQYCDKGFAIERALHIHLLEHCPKIPASERRKLNFKEMDHVNKAETPHFRIQRKVASLATQPSKDPLMNFPVKKLHDPKIGKIETELELLNKRKNNDIVKGDKHSASANGQSASMKMAPPISTKIKKKAAHTGVYRTPSKEIPCLSCKQPFKNLMDYTNHMMTAHKSLNPNNSSSSSDSSRID